METEDPRRRILINSLSAGLLTLVLKPKLAHADALYSEQAVKLPPGQSIYRLRGQVSVNGQEATLDTHIGPNAKVQTGANSEAIFVVGGHAMLVRENTDLIIKGTEKGMDKGNDNGTGAEDASFIVTALRLLTGKLLAVSRNQNYVLRTPTATIGIRGTGIYTEAEPDLTYFCTCYGKTTIFARNDPLSQDTVVATHHNRPVFISAKGKPGKHIQRAGFRNHTDEELLLIETIVGRTTPFKVPYDGPNPYLNDSP